MATATDVRHLLRRATLGPTAAEVDAAVTAGYDAALAALLTPAGTDPGATATPVPVSGPDPRPAGTPGTDRAAAQAARAAAREQVRTITAWWLERMVAARYGWVEALTFFWHGHFATSVQKVRSAALMLGQQRTFRDLGHGDFGALLGAMLRDPALVLWLDGQRNTRTAPNENLAREVMELFTLGIGHYSEADVRAAARALTGWRLDRGTGGLTLDPARHDSGTKTILGRTGDIDTAGFAAILLAQPAHAEFLAARMWYRFASGDPVPPDTLARLAGAYRPARDVTALARAVFTDPAFPGTARGLVKAPVQWLVGALRQLGVRPSALPVPVARALPAGLTALGQTLFAPPSVGGWPAGTAWLTTSATQQRLRLGTLLAGHADPAVTAALSGTGTAGRVDALARLLVLDGFTDRTRGVLERAGCDPARLLALGLASPEYAVC